MIALCPNELEDCYMMLFTQGKATYHASLWRLMGPLVTVTSQYNFLRNQIQELLIQKAKTNQILANR